ANLTNDKKIEQMARKILEGIALYANHPADEIKIQGIKNETAAVADDTTAPKITGKSIAGSLPNGPLYIVDGKIISKSEADKINPNDMQSVNVIKGADAIKEYGDKGSNGVIEITSKNKKEEEGSATIFAPPVIVKDDDKTKNTGIEIRNVKEEVNTASIIDSVVYVIDGKISTREKVNNIKPDNIESMNVLKGKNATDKYGDKAKNGAVEIILKK
ncbi:MAG TPA: TonB-dependent receptor plug domain-containing protein, partial [Panacibacter sp.]|nr:TonB-dependent receptor plug domain-containing protein [Panacibacter sp.]